LPDLGAGGLRLISSNLTEAQGRAFLNTTPMLSVAPPSDGTGVFWVS
jgi:hypothetical protein